MTVSYQEKRNYQKDVVASLLIIQYNLYTMFNIKLTPETLIMLPIAFFLDLCGLGLVVFGLDDLGLLDIIGIFIFFPWLLIRGERYHLLQELKVEQELKSF